MISRGFGVDNNIITRGFGSTVTIVIWNSVIKFSAFVKRVAQFTKEL